MREKSPLHNNVLYHCDCLSLLERLPAECATLAYLDPPWYPAIQFRDEDDEVGLRDHMLFLSHVLQQVRRILSKNGSLYFYSTPSLAGNIRPILDQVFDRKNYRQEIVWPHRKNGRHLRHPSHDTIDVYSKEDHYVYYSPTRSLTAAEIHARFPHKDQGGRAYRNVDLTVPTDRSALRFEWNGRTPPPGRSWRYAQQRLDEMQARGEIVLVSDVGMPKAKEYLDDEASLSVDIGSIWDDIPSWSSQARENVGYVGQQPLALLERIIGTGSNPLDFVLDPFCGSGTSLIAAQKLQRRWLGCDLSPDAITKAEERFRRIGLNDVLLIDQETLEREYPVVDQTYKRVFTGFDDASREMAERFVLDHVVSIEETRQYEFKEIIGSNPVNIIKNVADEYVVAFLNSEGGRIFWGVRDDRKVVGVPLDSGRRDELKKSIDSKLREIKPSIDPTQYRIHLHDVYADSKKIPDLYIIEIVVPHGSASELYYTGGNEVFVKTDSGKRKMTVGEIVDWVKQRMAI